MGIFIGIGAVLAWIISDIWLGIKIRKTGNSALKALLISLNVVVVLFTVILLYA